MGTHASRTAVAPDTGHLQRSIDERRGNRAGGVTCERCVDGRGAVRLRPVLPASAAGLAGPAPHVATRSADRAEPRKHESGPRAPRRTPAALTYSAQAERRGRQRAHGALYAFD
ncbi:hypothetical protein K1T71_007361 [Dendrolimus kikuchii]|uniref:Uncharacterized protein n=1 Tax=Dendrolimus kikuchii TaxID=765133 RepID=A0ACC1D1U6_9NEOP|nr:hypothetical protein K1T71_007361 [Dendrolimus kikuchii]